MSMSAKKPLFLPLCSLAAAALAVSCSTVDYYLTTFGVDDEIRGYEELVPIELIAERSSDAMPLNAEIKVTDHGSYKSFAWTGEFLLYPSAAYFNLGRNVNAVLREACSAHNGEYRPVGPWDKSTSEHVCFLKGSDTVLFDWSNAISGYDGERLDYTTYLNIAHKDRLEAEDWQAYSREHFVPRAQLPQVMAEYEAQGVKIREEVRALYDTRIRPQGLSEKEQHSLSLFERQWFSYIMLSERATGMQVCSLINRDTLTYRLGYITATASQRLHVYVAGAGRPLEGWNLAGFSPVYVWERPEKWQGDCPSLHKINADQPVDGMQPVTIPLQPARAAD